MRDLDLNAEVIQASAAGFFIGMHVSEIKHLIASGLTVFYKNGFNLAEAINNNRGILYVKDSSNDGGSTVTFGPDTVRLCFNKEEVLGCIYVFDGYKGKYRGVGLGESISKIREIEKLIYDSGDEMHYRVDSSGEIISGIAFAANGTEGDDTNEDPIWGFCVHDWSLWK